MTGDGNTEDMICAMLGYLQKIDIALNEAGEALIGGRTETAMYLFGQAHFTAHSLYEEARKAFMDHLRANDERREDENDE